MEPKIPPIKPAILLFGLALIKPLLFFPKRTPKNQARESHKNTIVRNIMRISLECSKNVILERNVKRYPM